MRKSSYIILILCPILLINISLTVTALEQRDYESAFEKIYKEIDEVTFVYDSTSITYDIYLGITIIDSTDNEALLIWGLFCITINDYYVSSSTCLANATLNIADAAKGIDESISGSDTDTSSFFTSNPVIYEFALGNFSINYDTFPITLDIGFSYELSSNQFTKTGSYSTTQTFSGPRIIMMNILIITLLIIGGVVGTIVFAVLRRKKTQIKYKPKEVEFHEKPVETKRTLPSFEGVPDIPVKEDARTATEILAGLKEFPCPSCGALNEVAGVFCHSCGYKFPKE